MARPRKLDPGLVPVLRRALAQGVSRKALCRAFGIGRATLWRALDGDGEAEQRGREGVLKHLSPVLKHRGAGAATAALGSFEPSAHPASGIEVFMGGFFSKPAAPAAPPPPPPPPAAPAAPVTNEAVDPAIEEERKKQIQLASQAKGRAATLLTGGQGDTSPAPLAKASLLGA